MRNVLSLPLLAAALGLGFLTPLRAADNVALAFDALGSGFDYTQGSYSLGWRFTTNQDIQVTALGFYDDNQDGLLGSHPVGIFDANTQQLLGSTTVDPSDTLTGFFRYHAVTPFTLPAGGDYYIAAVTFSDRYAVNVTTLAIDPAITFVGYAGVSASESHTPTLTCPEASSDNPGFHGDFGPSFKFAAGAGGGGTPGDASAAAILPGSATSIPNNASTSSGWLFTPQQDITVSSVGYYDDGADGFLDSHLVAIWDAVLKTEVVGDVTVSTADPLRGGFRYHALNTAVTLAKGHPYFIMGTTGRDPYIATANGLTTNSSLTFGGLAFSGQINPLGPIFPDHVDKTSTGIFGPNFEAAFKDEPTAQDSLFAAVGFTSPGALINAGNGSLGWAFTPKKDLQVASVGYFEDTTQLPRSHTVAIFDALLEVAVLSDTTVLSTDPLRGHFRYHSVPRLTLSKGRPYFIMGNSDITGYVTAAKQLTTSPLITFGGGASSGIVDPLGVQYPDVTNKSGKGYFGPNFEIVPGNGQYIQVSVDAPSISRAAGQVATITLTRGGLVDTTQDITIKFAVDGTLTEGVDFAALGGSKVLKVGKSSVNLKIKPLPGGANGALTLTLKATNDYDAPAPASVKVKIVP